MPTASIKAQIHPGGTIFNGQAGVVPLNTVLDLTNADGSGTSWHWVILALSGFGSSSSDEQTGGSPTYTEGQVIGTTLTGTQLTLNFYGSIALQLIVDQGLPTEVRDTKVFAVAYPGGFVNPPFGADQTMVNFGGNTHGTAWITDAWAHALRLASQGMFIVNGVGTGRVAGPQIVNNTPATLGNPQYSAQLILQGQAWASTPAASRTVAVALQLQTIDGTTNPSGVLDMSMSVNGGSWAPLAQFFTFGGGTISVAGVDTSSLSMGFGGVISGTNFSIQPAALSNPSNAPPLTYRAPAHTLVHKGNTSTLTTFFDLSAGGTPISLFGDSPPWSFNVYAMEVLAPTYTSSTPFTLSLAAAMAVVGAAAQAGSLTLTRGVALYLETEGTEAGIVHELACNFNHAAAVHTAVAFYQQMNPMGGFGIDPSVLTPPGGLSAANTLTASIPTGARWGVLVNATTYALLADANNVTLNATLRNAVAANEVSSATAGSIASPGNYAGFLTAQKSSGGTIHIPYFN